MYSIMNKLGQKKFFSFSLLLSILLCLIVITGFSQEQNREKEKQPEVAKASTPSNTQPSKKEATEVKTNSPPDEKTVQYIQHLLKRKYAPPLSLFESIRLTENVRELINPGVTIFKGPRKEKSLTLMNLIIDYVKLTDDRASSLLFYRWYYIGRHRVISEQIQEEKFTPRPLIKNVSAISFNAERADVHIHFMKVIDLKGNTTSFKIDKWILKNLPRKEVCFLYFPTTIKEIVLDYSTRPNTWARLRVFAGVTDRPEYAKAGLYYLASAKKEIENSTFDKADKHLVKAKDYLIKFNRQLRLD